MGFRVLKWWGNLSLCQGNRKRKKLREKKKDRVPTTTVPDAEVEGSTRLWGDAEIHGAVVPSLISINRPQHLHHLKENEGEQKRRGRMSVCCECVCVCRCVGVERLRGKKRERKENKRNGKTLTQRVLFRIKPLANVGGNPNKPISKRHK